MPRTSILISPYKETLINLLPASESEREALLEKAYHLPSLQLSSRSLQDLELMAVGAFSPLATFMGQADYERVLTEMRLADGTLFPMPITLPVHDPSAFAVGMEIALRTPHNNIVAILTINEIFKRHFKREAQAVFQTLDSYHPLVAEMSHWGEFALSGSLTVIQLPKHVDFSAWRRTPRELRAVLEKMGQPHVVAFQTRNPMHRVHEELTKQAAKLVGGTLLLHPTVGTTRIEDVESSLRVKTYEAMYEQYYDHRRTVLSLLPLAMRFAGPREALWHAIIRRNYGASHFIVGRDHASPGVDSHGQPFYDPYAAQRLIQEYSQELGIKPVLLEELVYVPSQKKYLTPEQAGSQSFFALSGTQVRNEYLAQRKKLPSWFTRPPVAKILAEHYRPKHTKGFCVWLTGLPCAGKSTIAELLEVELQQRGRSVTLLDGDVVRTHLSKGLGFSKADRDTNVLRIGFVASEIVKHHGVAICAAVSPYENTRNQVRNLMPEGTFMLVYVDTPVEICEQRDTKGLYTMARQGKVKDFTGVDDVYESPRHPEIHLKSKRATPAKQVADILAYLQQRGLIK